MNAHFTRLAGFVFALSFLAVVFSANDVFAQIKYEMGGYVYINSQPAPLGFGVKATSLADGSVRSALVHAEDGRYDFHGDVSLPEGTYVLDEEHPCTSNLPITITVPVTENKGPNVFLDCTVPTHSLSGYVFINSQPAPIGFGVTMTGTDGSVRSAMVSSEGKYEFSGDIALPEGNYTMHHSHPCPSDTPVEVSIPAMENRGPDIHLDCTPPTFPLSGKVTINSNSAPQGFGVTATHTDGTISVALVNDLGIYEFSLKEGTYIISHDHPCPSNTPMEVKVPAANNQAPEIQLDCTPPTYALTGKVTINGDPAPVGFGIKAVADDGTVYLSSVHDNSTGSYEFSGESALPAGSYTIGHDHPCVDNGPFHVDIPVDNMAPDINLTCVVTTYEVWGYAYSDNIPAPPGFGVKATREDGAIFWGIVTAKGRFEMNLPAGDYVYGHDGGCVSSVPTINISSTQGRGPDYYVSCPKQVQLPPAVVEQTCGAITQVASTSSESTDFEAGLYLPILMSHKPKTTTMDQYVELVQQLHKLYPYVVLIDGRQVFYFGGAKQAGFSDVIILLLNEAITYQNILLAGLADTNNFHSEILIDRFPSLKLFVEAATEYSKSEQVQVTLSDTECTCGSFASPQPSQPIGNQSRTEDSQAAAEEYLRERDYNPTQALDYVQSQDWRWTRRQTWNAEMCGFEKFRDSATYHPNNDGKWIVEIRDYQDRSPRGEPNPEIGLHGGPVNWPYPLWGLYVIWWHTR